jgi:hypothetical protein
LIVGVPAVTVKTRMFYARNKMADLLQQAGRALWIANSTYLRLLHVTTLLGGAAVAVIATCAPPLSECSNFFASVPSEQHISLNCAAVID